MWPLWHRSDGVNLIGCYIHQLDFFSPESPDCFFNGLKVTDLIMGTSSPFSPHLHLFHNVFPSRKGIILPLSWLKEREPRAGLVLSHVVLSHFLWSHWTLPNQPLGGTKETLLSAAGLLSLAYTIIFFIYQTNKIFCYYFTGILFH